MKTIVRTAGALKRCFSKEDESSLVVKAIIVVTKHNLAAKDI